MNKVLKAAREVAGKTQAQVAKEAGCTPLAYQRYEYGERKPKVDTALKIAKALGSTVEKLFGAATPDKEVRTTPQGVCDRGPGGVTLAAGANPGLTLTRIDANV